MKKKFISAILTACLVMAPMSVNASEMILGDMESEESFDIVEETLNGTEKENAIAFGSESSEGHIFIKAGDVKYIYNVSGTTVYINNRWVDGKYGFEDKPWENNVLYSCLANSKKDMVMFYRYNAKTHRLLLAWVYAKEWRFFDVFPCEEDWAYPGIKYCSDRGYMNGDSEGNFNQNDKLTRGMVATVLYNVAGKPATEYKSTFGDVHNGNWAAIPITWGVNSGIFKGYGDGTFGKDDNVTREQLAVMMYHFAKYSGRSRDNRADIGIYADSNQVSSWAKDAFSWAVANKVLSGAKVDGVLYLNPKAEASRAECATIIKNFMGD